MIRAKRIVSVRETQTGDKHKIRSDVYKRLSDPFSKIVARPLYGNNVAFSPQHLCIFCSNGATQFDEEGQAVKARMAVVEHSQVFVDTPTEANQET
jgi:phage/plasmid-associated DNA primase